MKLIGKIQFTVVVFVISNLSSIQETMSSATPKTKTTHTNHSFYNVVKHDDQKGARYSYTTVNLKPHPDIEHYCKALNISKLDCNCDNIPSFCIAHNDTEWCLMEEEKKDPSIKIV